MPNPLHLIYIPGLGDSQSVKQGRIVNTWRWYGVGSETYKMYWDDDRSWDTKFQELLQHIDELQSADKTVALVGASAGATAVINAYAARKDTVVACVLIAGKVNRPQTIGARYQKRFPSFVTAARACAEALETLPLVERRCILSRYGLFDETVRTTDSRIAGARNQTVPVVGHAFIIGTQLIFGAPGFIRFIKRCQKLAHY